MSLEILINGRKKLYLLHGQPTSVNYHWWNKVLVIAVFKANNFLQLGVKIGKREDSFEFITNSRKPYFTLIGIGSSITWKRIPLHINFLNIKRGEEKLRLKYEKDLSKDLLNQGIFEHFQNNSAKINKQAIAIKNQEIQLKVKPNFKIIYPN